MQILKGDLIQKYLGFYYTIVSSAYLFEENITTFGSVRIITSFELLCRYI